MFVVYYFNIKYYNEKVAMNQYQMDCIGENSLFLIDTNALLL